MKTTMRISILLSVLALSACSTRVSPGTISNNGVVGMSIGGATAALAGNHIGARHNMAEAGAVIGAGAGILGGLIAGEAAEAQRLENIRRNSPPKRIPVYENKFDNSSELNKQRYELEKNSKMGAGETKSWDERYLGSEDDFPYQGY